MLALAQSSTNTTVTVSKANGSLQNATNFFSGNTNWIVPAIAPFFTSSASSGGITSLGGLTAGVQTLGTGTTGSDFGISSSGSAHTFNLPTASGSVRGALSSADWTTFNGKVGSSRQVIAGAGLAGGGSFVSDVTLTLATTSSGIASAISDETGSGALVFGTSPTLTTPVLGAATATSVNGTTIPSSKTLVVTTDTIAALASTTSAQLSGVLSDESGSGSALFGTSPTITTPTISGSVTFPAGTRQTFAPNTTTPGFNVGSVASDPSSLSNGDLWLQSTSGRIRARVGGASVDVATGAQQDFELGTVTSGASIAFDLNGNQTQTLTLGTDATTLTTSNRSASKGRAISVFITASGAQRTLTLNGSWKNYGPSASVVIPSGKEATLYLFALGSNETDVRVDYKIQP